MYISPGGRLLLWCFCGALLARTSRGIYSLCPYTNRNSLLDIAAATFEAEPTVALHLKTSNAIGNLGTLINAAAEKERDPFEFKIIWARNVWQAEGINRTAFHSIQIGWKVQIEMHFYLIYFFFVQKGLSLNDEIQIILPRKFDLNSTADYYELVPCVLINYSWIGKKKLIVFPGGYHLFSYRSLYL